MSHHNLVGHLNSSRRRRNRRLQTTEVMLGFLRWA